MHTVIGAFDDRDIARRAVDRLVQSGFDRNDIHVQQGDLPDATSRQQQDDREGKGWFSNFFHDLFGTEDQANTGHAHTYDEVVRRGSSVVVVDAQDGEQAERAASLLHELGTVDVDERAQQWRAQGWIGGTPQAPGRGQEPSTGQQASLPGRAGPMDRGGVRVVQRVSQKPVREMVPLREERARVEAAEDTLRRKDADVQRLQGGERSMTERERATAADRSRPPLAGRDPDAADSSLGGGTLRKPRKDKPTP